MGRRKNGCSRPMWRAHCRRSRHPRALRLSHGAPSELPTQQDLNPQKFPRGLRPRTYVLVKEALKSPLAQLWKCTGARGSSARMIPGVITPPEYIRTNTVHMYAHRWERFPHTARGAMAAVVRSAFSGTPDVSRGVRSLISSPNYHHETWNTNKQPNLDTHWGTAAEVLALSAAMEVYRS